MTLLGCTEDVAVPARDESPIARIEYPALAAHRGGGDVYPESTMQAFRAVTEKYPDMLLEMDVHRLKDGPLVIWHNVEVNGTAIKDMTTAQWKKIVVPNPAGGLAPAAFLTEVLEEFGGTETTLLVELKALDASQDFIAAVWPFRSNIIVQNFNAEQASVFIRSGLKTLRLSSSWLPPIMDGGYAVGTRHDLISPDVVKAVHDAGQRMWAWTVDTQSEIDALFAMGVDGVMTDDPRLTI